MNTTVDIGKLRLKSGRYGDMLFLPNDEYIGGALDRYGEFSEGEAYFFKSLIQPNWVVLDVGANMGAHTIAFSTMAAVVHAFEPQRTLFQILTANAALSGRDIHTYNVAVGREAGTITVPVVDYTKPFNFGALELGGPGESVPLITIDSLNLRPDFIKIDVEGMEGEVIYGAKHTLRRCHPILYMENDRSDNSPDLIDQLFKLDYRLYWHLPYYFNTNNYYHNPNNVYGGTISVNMLAVPMGFSCITDLREIKNTWDTWRV